MIEQIIDQLIERTIDQLIDWPIDWLIERVIDQLTDWPIDWLTVSWLTECRVSLLVCLVKRDAIQDILILQMHFDIIYKFWWWPIAERNIQKYWLTGLLAIEWKIDQPIDWPI